VTAASNCKAFWGDDDFFGSYTDSTKHLECPRNFYLH